MHEEPIVEPTTADEPVTTPEDDGELSAARILKLNETSPEETVEPETEAEPAKDPEADTPVEIPPADEEADTSEVEENDLQLDAELAANPALKKRWDERMQGVDKLVERNKAQADALGSWTQIADALENPETAFEAYEHIGNVLRKLHGKAPQTQAEPTTPVTGKETDWEDLGFDSKEDYKAFQNAAHSLYGPVIDALNAKIAKLEGDVEGTKAESAKAKAEREKSEKAQRYAAWIQVTAPKVVEQAAKEHQGWKITPEMVDKSVRKFPHLTSNPIEAVTATYAKELNAHYAKANRGNAPKGPELNTETSRNAGSVWPDDPENLTAAQILAARGT